MAGCLMWCRIMCSVMAMCSFNLSLGTLRCESLSTFTASSAPAASLASHTTEEAPFPRTLTNSSGPDTPPAPGPSHSSNSLSTAASAVAPRRSPAPSVGNESSIFLHDRSRLESLARLLERGEASVGGGTFIAPARLSSESGGAHSELAPSSLDSEQQESDSECEPLHDPSLASVHSSSPSESRLQQKLRRSLEWPALSSSSWSLCSASIAEARREFCPEDCEPENSACASWKPALSPSSPSSDSHSAWCWNHACTCRVPAAGACSLPECAAPTTATDSRTSGGGG
mmetsp:Transcript_8101/g.15398  ORF Transcript_8101/g.15398 Transcript_8101/m.15398 type:complete len:286 (-) Transcript_8101:1396-2253(-)